MRLITPMTALEVGMVLEGVVSNVANFGAFVDIGVHQDGLVHISALTDRYVADPREVVKAGDIVKVKVMEVDVQRKRIALSMRLNDEPGQDNRTQRSSEPRNNQNQTSRRLKIKKSPAQMSGAFVFWYSLSMDSISWI